MFSGSHRIESSKMILDESVDLTVKEVTNNKLVINYVSSEEAEITDLVYER